MRSRDWSLVFLTILSQGSVGLVLCSIGHAGPGAVTPLLLALFLIVVATSASFFHLGNPMNAPKALRNLSGSWLSREILAIGVFTLFLLAALFSAGTGGGNVISRLHLLPASVAGLLLLWTMTRVYLIPTIPPWNHWYTPVSFIATSLSLGLIGSLLLMDLERWEVSFCMGLLAVILALELLTALKNHHRLTGMNSGFDGPTFKQGNYYRLFITRMIILAATCVAILFFLLQQDVYFASGTLTWMYPVFALVIIQEVAGRLMFYASYFRVGI